MAMKLSVHSQIRGKPSKVKVSEGYEFFEYKGKKVDLGNNWVNIEADWDDVFELITTDGMASSAELTDQHRSSRDFVSRDLFMIDIDSGMTIQELLNNNFYNEFGAGFYVTPSHTDDHHRFRIMFRTEYSITDAEKAKKIYRALMRIYDYADVACKDPARIFYGTVDCIIKEKTDKLLDHSTINLMCLMEDKFKDQNIKVHDTVEHEPLSDERKQKMLDLLKSTYVGQYPIWRNIGWGMKNAGFSLSDFQYVTQGMMKQKSPEDASKLWSLGKNTTDACTLGTVIYFLKQNHGEEFMKDFWKQTEPPKTITGKEALKAIRKEKYKVKNLIRNGNEYA